MSGLTAARRLGKRSSSSARFLMMFQDTSSRATTGNRDTQPAASARINRGADSPPRHEALSAQPHLCGFNDIR